jgi:hypothetical protein
MSRTQNETGGESAGFLPHMFMNLTIDWQSLESTRFRNLLGTYNENPKTPGETWKSFTLEQSETDLTQSGSIVLIKSPSRQ